MTSRMVGNTPIFQPRISARWDYEAFTRDPRTIVAPLLKQLAVLFNKHGELGLMTALYARQIPRLGAPFIPADRIFLTGLDECNEQTKDMLVSFVKGLVVPMQLQAIAWGSEVWEVRRTDPAVREELRAWQRAHNGSYAGFRLATESVSLLLDTRSSAMMFKAPIERPARGRAQVGAWEEQADIRGWTGRLLSVFAEAVPAASEA